MGTSLLGPVADWRDYRFGSGWRFTTRHSNCLSVTPGLEEGSENVLPEGPEAEAGRDEKNQRHEFIASEQQEGNKGQPAEAGYYNSETRGRISDLLAEGDNAFPQPSSVVSRRFYGTSLRLLPEVARVSRGLGFRSHRAYFNSLSWLRTMRAWSPSRICQQARPLPTRSHSSNCQTTFLSRVISKIWGFLSPAWQLPIT